MADCQKTGGYATLTAMIADDHSLAEIVPGNSLSFVVGTWDKTADILRSGFAQLERRPPLAASDASAYFQENGLPGFVAP